MKFLNFFYFCYSFLPSWIRIQPTKTNADPVPQNCFVIYKHKSFSYLLVLFLCAEVSLDNIKGLLIDLHVLVGLEELDLVEAEDLLYDDSVGVGAPRLLGLLFAQPQDVLQPV